MNTIILKSRHPLSAVAETGKEWQTKKGFNKHSYRLHDYQSTNSVTHKGSTCTEKQKSISTRSHRILDITAFNLNGVYEMEQHVFRTLKGIIFFFFPVISGFKIAFKLFWSITCSDCYFYKWTNQSIPLKIREYEENP